MGQGTDAPDRESGRAAARMPAIAVIVVGSLGFVAAAGSLVMSRVVIEATRAGEADPQQQKLIEFMYGTSATVIHGSGILLAGLAIAGGLAMLRTKARGLAFAGAICAMLIPSVCCCVLGIPAGIWALMTLSKPNVKAAFE